MTCKQIGKVLVKPLKAGGEHHDDHHGVDSTVPQ